MINISILKSSTITDSKTLDLVKKTTRFHAARAAKILNVIDPVNITVYFNPDWVIPSTGETGYTPTADWIQITLDLTGKKFPIKTVIEKRLPVTIYHEMAHIKRWQTTGFGSTFHEELVSEGLACAFEVEQFKHDITPLFETTEKEIQKMLTIVKAEAKRIKSEYSYQEWFMTGSNSVPQYLGYKLGYHVIKNVLQKNPSLKVTDLMGLTTKEIVKISKITI